MKKITKLITHGGVFHADEVFSTAMLKMLYPDAEIVRTFNVTDELCKDDQSIIYDIGFGMYDHHQANRQVRQDGTPYAAFGLLWHDFWDNFVLNEEIAQRFDEGFIEEMDLHDNTGCGNSIATLIGDFLPTWEEDSSNDAQFLEAVEFATSILKRRFKQINAKFKAKEIVLEEYSMTKNNEICVLKKCIPWKDALCQSDAKFVIYPSLRGGWNAQVVPVETASNIAKVEFPMEWWGKKENLPMGVTFCHANGFLLAANTEEIAYSCCKTALQNKKGM